MPGYNPSPSKQNDQIPTRAWNRLLDIAARIIKLDVQPPLDIIWIRNTPTIRLQGGLIRSGLTSSTITARVGTQMGQGTVTPYRTLATGQLVPASGNDITCFSKYGATIASDIWVDYALVDERWEIVGGDCSGASAT